MLRIKLLTVTGLSIVVPTLTNFLFPAPPAAPSAPTERPPADTALDSSGIRSVALEAAREHRVDPNVVLSVMETESCFQTDAISPRGAVGLMQIMPRTGRLIADAVGRDDFTTADLLSPETNIDFAAWYLASLIQRFDGRLPLAIASYNGGPHNVRRWLRDHGENMPLDAFLERIPFSQTHRYVRRVLTHYAAYREQQGLPMERLSTTLPPLDERGDHVAF